MKAPIMAHLVAGFPDNTRALGIGTALLEGGASFLEVQLPFSDPSADGPTIQAACQQALDGGFKVADGFQLVAQLRAAGDAPIYMMSYANLPFRRGVAEFLARCQDSGATGVIVPDLPLDYDEGLYAESRRLGLEALPVVPVSAPLERLDKVVKLSQARSLYAALRAGVTGRQTRIDEVGLTFLRHIRSLGVRLLAGFGISAPEQVRHLAPEVDVLIVGSAFVREIQSAIQRGIPEAPSVRDLMRRFAGALDRTSDTA